VPRPLRSHPRTGEEEQRDADRQRRRDQGEDPQRGVLADDVLDDDRERLGQRQRRERREEGVDEEIRAAARCAMEKRDRGEHRRRKGRREIARDVVRRRQRDERAEDGRGDDRGEDQTHAGTIARVRLWSLHPRYLDPPGLVVLWREGLLAQAVLAGRTRGYTRHPQLERFRECRNPLAAIATYLAAVAREARQRGYAFDESRLLRGRTRRRVSVSEGQLQYELAHLRAKLRLRNGAWHARLAGVAAPEAHPLFVVVGGGGGRGGASEVFFAEGTFWSAAGGLKGERGQRTSCFSVKASSEVEPAQQGAFASRPQELLAVVMNEVVGIGSDPDLRLPRDVVHVTLELLEIEERGDV